MYRTTHLIRIRLHPAYSADNEHQFHYGQSNPAPRVTGDKPSIGEIVRAVRDDAQHEGSVTKHRLKITLAQTQQAPVRFDDVAMRYAMRKQNRRLERLH